MKLLWGLPTILLLSLCGVPRIATAREPDASRPAATPGWTVFPSVRVAAGADVRLTGTERLSVAGDASAGLRVLAPMRPPRLGVALEAGYSYAGASPGSVHLFTAGLGPWLTTGSVGIGWMPRFVVGADGGDGAIGLRNGLVVDLAALVTAELAHQYLHTSGSSRHDLRLTFGVDLGLAIYVLSQPTPRARGRTD